MASITFTGPTLDGNVSTTVVDMDDQAFLAVIQAVCGSEGYTGDNPGLFVIQKTVQNWTHITKHYHSKIAHAEADAQVASIIDPLRASVSVQIDGTSYDLDTLNEIQS